MPDVTLITPTGDRGLAFSLCECWISLQTFRGELQWIVVDDGEQPTETTLDQEVVRLEPMEGTSLVRNLLAAIDLVRSPYVLIIEDDDWYGPNYIRAYLNRLQDADLVGEGFARYYHIPTRQWQRQKNAEHASLAQTGFSEKVLPMFKEVCQNAVKPFVDLQLWRRWCGKRRPPDCSFMCFSDKWDELQLHCGIKGLPGRAGIGQGHRPKFHRWEQDPELVQLVGWVGKPAADLYTGIRGMEYKGPGC